MPRSIEVLTKKLDNNQGFDTNLDYANVLLKHANELIRNAPTVSPQIPTEEIRKRRASLGGKAVAQNRTPDERSEVARNAAIARWHSQSAELARTERSEATPRLPTEEIRKRRASLGGKVASQYRTPMERSELAKNAATTPRLPTEEIRKRRASLGGKAVAQNRTPDERSEVARNAAIARWHSQPKN